MAVTLVEIASLAGVSRGTVDRALNNRGRVDPEVADRVRRIAAELGYRPNREGRLLALAKNPIKIGIIVQSVETMFMHMVFEEVMRTQAQLTTPGAEIYVRPIQGVDAERQLAAIDELQSRTDKTYAFVTVSQLAAIHGITLEPGVVYNGLTDEVAQQIADGSYSPTEFT